MRLGESVWNSVDQAVLNGYSQIPKTLPELEIAVLQGTHSKAESALDRMSVKMDETGWIEWMDRCFDNSFWIKQKSEL